jgi:hypothetical protein
VPAVAGVSVFFVGEMLSGATTTKDMKIWGLMGFEEEVYRGLERVRLGTLRLPFLHTVTDSDYFFGGTTSHKERSDTHSSWHDITWSLGVITLRIFVYMTPLTVMYSHFFRMLCGETVAYLSIK